MVKHLSHEFFARSPQNLTVLAPFMVLKQSNFGENVQKTRVTGVLPLDPVRNGAYFHEILLVPVMRPLAGPTF